MSLAISYLQATAQLTHFVCVYYYVRASTVKPPKRDHSGDEPFSLCREVGLVFVV